jgi:anti-sigma B factor antagonist
MGELLTVVEERTADAHILSVEGEIDLGTVASLEQAVTTALGRAEHALLVIDLSQVGFLSSAGISALLKTKQSSEELSVAFRLVVPQGAVMRRSLEITGLLDVLPIYTSREAALAG